MTWGLWYMQASFHVSVCCKGRMCFKQGTQALQAIVWLQDLIKLQKRVKANEQELGGFENAMEELRAAGRMEAMENLMQTVVDALVSS